MRVIIDGQVYVPQCDVMSQEVRNALSFVYGRLWTEAYYDPRNKATCEFAQPLADKMCELNGILKFKT